MEFVKTLGKGEFGEVTLLKSIRTGELFVAKTVEGDSEKIKAGISRESKALNRIKFKCEPYLLCLHNIQQPERNKTVFLFKYLPGSYEMYELIKTRMEFTPYTKYVIVERLMLGLLQLHRMGVVHRDIKPQNVMLNPKMLTPVYIDFGLACTSEETKCLRSLKGTPNYVAPEVLTSSNLASFEQVKKSDVWSLGITILLFCTGKLPWEDHKMVRSLYQEIKMTTQGKMDYNLDEIAEEVKSGSFWVSLVRGMLNVDWRQRESIEQALHHLYQGADNLMRSRGRQLGMSLEKITEKARQEATYFVVPKGTPIMGTTRNPLNKTI